MNGEFEKLRSECGWDDAAVGKAIAQFQHHKEYQYKYHFGPHDLKNTEISIGVSRMNVAKQHGIKFKLVPKTDVLSGIDLVRKILINVYFDADLTLQGTRALKEYHKKWNETLQKYDDNPVHDWSSHGADGFRYLAQAVITFINRSMDRAKPTLEADHKYNPFEQRVKQYDDRDEEIIKGKIKRRRTTQFAVVDYDVLS